VKVHSLVEELIEIIEQAKAVPLSQSCIINRSEVLDLLDELLETLPKELSQAESLLKDRQSVIEGAQVEAERIVQIARADAAVLVSQERVYKEALAESERLTHAVDEDHLRKRRELDDYIDAKLGAFEIALTKTLAAVQAGRERTAVRLQAELANDEGPTDPGNFFGDWNDPRP
jgi:cell division septum initiation protein DivIVA